MGIKGRLLSRGFESIERRGLSQHATFNQIGPQRRLTDFDASAVDRPEPVASVAVAGY